MSVVERPEHQVYLGLGSNIQPEENMPKAVAFLREYVSVSAVSTAWETPPVGTASGPDFLNAVALIYTGLSPKELKTQVIRKIESRLGRVRTEDKNAPRTIDLDILIVDGNILYPGIWKYAYLAVPLAEILPDYTNPESTETVAQAAKRLAQITRIVAHPEILQGIETQR